MTYTCKTSQRWTLCYLRMCDDGENYNSSYLGCNAVSLGRWFQGVRRNMCFWKVGKNSADHTALYPSRLAYLRHHCYNLKSQKISFKHPRGLRRCYAAASFLGLRVRIPPEEWMSVMNVMCCQVQGSVSGWWRAQKNHNECGVSEYDRESSTVRRPWPTSPRRWLIIEMF
jgi:hypothetical protein